MSKDGALLTSCHGKRCHKDGIFWWVVMETGDTKNAPFCRFYHGNRCQ